VSGDVRGAIESALNNLKEALKSDDADRIKKAMENLNQTAYKLGEEIYKNVGQRGGQAGEAGPQGAADRGAAPGTSGGDGNKKKDEDVIDAEYEVKE
jgi:molecular chaperone DnaK